MSTKAALVNSALDFAHERGFVDTSYADLSEVIGIRKASIHHHFPSKDDLSIAMIEENQRRILSLFEIVKKRKLNGFQKLRAFIRKTFNPLAANQRVCIHGVLSVENQSLNEIAKAKLRESHEAIAECIFALLSEGKKDGSLHCTSPKQSALMLTATIQGGLQVARVRNQKLFNQIIETALNTIKPQRNLK